ncbi:MAG TPA: NUDIX domain-containing protein [Jatrophihabitans sp.]|nr:NUDIX domain-containing protein [Jatrophihabitans sp.]
MVSRRSAGLLLYRNAPTGIEVLLAHPGGPLWARRDDGAWTVPKGEYGPDEEPLAAARREFAEEMGRPAPAAPGLVDLGEVRQRSGKIVTAWALEGDFDTSGLVSNTFEMEWPPHSGRRCSFPEIDRAQWFPLPTARAKMVPAQAEFLDRLVAALEADGS